VTFSLPIASFAMVIAAAGVGVGALALPIIWFFKPGSMSASPWAVAVVVGGSYIGLTAIAPWRSRDVGRWALLWLLSRALCFVAVLLLAALVYFAAPVDPVVLGLLIVPMYLAVLTAESVVFAARVRRCGAQADASSLSTGEKEAIRS